MLSVYVFVIMICIPTLYLFPSFTHSISQVVAGSYCTYMIKYDGSLVSLGDGSYGRLGHGGSDNETNLRTISALRGERPTLI